jgi:hypothetical protein
MSNFLFDIPESLSPFLKWKKAHDLRTWETPTESDPWTCCSRQHVDDGEIDDDTATIGATEQEACENFCLMFGVPHWLIAETVPGDGKSQGGSQ